MVQAGKLIKRTLSNILDYAVVNQTKMLQIMIS